MIYLPDVNVWLALAAERHVHHTRARRWFESLTADTVLFCRVTQMGFLRLLTNHHVLAEDVLSAAGAWDVYEDLRRDDRVSFSAEPTGLEERWRGLTQQGQISGATWTDTYLISFALLRNERPVSCDRAFLVVPHTILLQ